MISSSTLAETERHRLYLYILAGLTAAGLLLRLYHLGAQSFWLDEVRCIYSGRLPLGPTFYHHSWSPPLYNVLIHFLIKLSEGEFFLRLHSALFGAATIPMLYAMGRRLVGDGAALAAAAFLALSPFHINYSQEVGYYSIILFLYTLSFFCLFRFRERGGIGDLVGCVLATGAGLWIQYTTVYIIVVQNLILFIDLRHERRRLGAWIASQAALALIIALPLFLTHYLENVEPLKQMNPFYLRVRPWSYFFLAVPYSMYTFCVGFSFGPPLQMLRSGAVTEALRSFGPAIGIAAFLFGAVFFSGLSAGWRRKEVELRNLLLFLVLPTLSSLILALMHGFPLSPRFLIGAFPPFALLVGLGWEALPSGWMVRRVFGAALLAVLALSIKGYYVDPLYSREDARSTARFLEERVEPEDEVIAVSSYFASYPMAFYYKGPGRIHYFSPDEEIRREDVAEMLEEIGPAPKIWLVLSRAWENDPGGVVEDYLGTVGAPCGTRAFAGVRILAFCMEGGPP